MFTIISLDNQSLLLHTHYGLQFFDESCRLTARNTLHHTDASTYRNMLFPCPLCLIKFHRLSAASSIFPKRSNFEQNVKVPIG